MTIRFSTLVTRTVLSAMLSLLSTSPSSAVNDVTIDGNFADWADELCQPDETCDDFLGQRDAKGACAASNFVGAGAATIVYLRFDFNVTARRGANTADACVVVDTNQNGNVDRAVCLSLQGNPLVLQTAQMFICNDTMPTSCGGPVPVASDLSCDENANVLPSRQLTMCPGDSADTAIECSFSLGAAGALSGPITVLACTSTSAQPNSSTFDCLPIINPIVPVQLQEFSVE
jgi:hypothetical protein